ncbi:MAG: PEGA domain-containing protein, partial [Pseudomonadota bacterium]
MRLQPIPKRRIEPVVSFRGEFSEEGGFGGLALGSFCCFVLMIVIGGGCSGTRSNAEDAKKVPLGRVRITSVPSGAVVLIDDTKREGKTPLTIERPGGTRLNLRIIKDGYKYYREVAWFAAGATQDVHVVLRRATGFWIVKTGPIRGAKIFVDGQMKGKTPDRVEMEIGQRKIQLVHDGYYSHTEHVTVEADISKTIDVDLMPLGKQTQATGRFSLITDVLSSVFVDGVLLGTTPIERIRLRAKEYQLEVKNPVLKLAKKLQVTVKPNEHLQLRVFLKQP